jgi:hypothetical protein
VKKPFVSKKAMMKALANLEHALTPKTYEQEAAIALRSLADVVAAGHVKTFEVKWDGTHRVDVTMELASPPFAFVRTDIKVTR